MIKRTTLSCGVSILLALTFTPLDSVNAATDGTKIVAIARHSFRGINKKVGPQEIALEDYGIPIKTLPILSWAEDSTPRGQEIARDYGGVGLQKAAEVAVKAVNENEMFDGHWDIRADLSTERTLVTAVRIKEGLKETTNVTGCPTTAGEPLDVVTTRKPAMQCAKKEIRSLRSASPDLDLFRQRAASFLDTVKKAHNIKDAKTELPPATYDAQGKLPKVYSQIANLASAFEMSADLAPPLDVVFPGSDPSLGKQVVESALNFMGIRFFTSNPKQAGDAVSLYPLQYMEDRKPGSHTLMLTHDDLISDLLRALDIIDSKSEPGDLAVYPLDTIVFAFGKDHVSIVRMRLEVRDPDGYIPGPLANKILWKGTLAEWNQKVKNIKDRVKTWKISAETQSCLDNLSQNVCQAEAVDVRF